MDGDRRSALSRFYCDEFLRHIEHLQAAGILDESNQEVADRARRALITRLDQVCLLRGFPAVAETLLQSFDTLSGFSLADPRQRH